MLYAAKSCRLLCCTNEHAVVQSAWQHPAVWLPSYMILFLESKLSKPTAPLLTRGTKWSAGNHVGVRLCCCKSGLSGLPWMQCWHHHCCKERLSPVSPSAVQTTAQASFTALLMRLQMTLPFSPLLAAMGEPRRWSGGGNQRSAEWPLGSKRRLPLSWQNRPEPRSDESQCHQ